MYTLNAEHQGAGIYLAELESLPVGDYSVLITLANDYTEADSDVSNVVDTSMLWVKMAP